MDPRKLALIALPVILLALWIFAKADALKEPWPVRNSPATRAGLIAFGNRAAPQGLAEALGMQIPFVGSPDMTTEQARASVDQVLASAAGTVLLTLGPGDLDARLPLESTVMALETVIDRLQAQGVMVAYLYEAPEGIGDNWKLAIQDVCRRKGVLWLERAGTSEDLDTFERRLRLHLRPPA